MRPMTFRPARLLTLALIALGIVAVERGVRAQITDGPWAVVAYHRVAPGAEEAFEQLMRSSWKPIHRARRESGTIVTWMLYRVHLTGADDEYQYVSVTYCVSWAQTEAAADWAGLARAAGASPLVPTTNTTGPIVRQAIYNRLESVSRPGAPPFKYAVMDFMKVKDGMLDAYLRVEREDWKPLHQVLTNEGNRVGWGLWDWVNPGGVGSPHDFMTGMFFTDYVSIKAANDAAAYLKAHPRGDLAASVARTRQSRDVVRTEVWEVVDALP